MPVVIQEFEAVEDRLAPAPDRQEETAAKQVSEIDAGELRHGLRRLAAARLRRWAH